MIGRAEERALIGGLLATARSGRSGTLVLSGEPGVGKSVLLAHAVEQAGGMRVLQATGVETEVDLAFAGLHQLLRPVLDLVHRLPVRQADALLGALGLADYRGEDRYLVAVATLSLLSEAAGDGSVLCTVEDAHWLDRPSAEALAFVARRLDAEGVVLLAATREGAWPGLAEQRIGAFGRDDAEALLRQPAGEVAPRVLDHLLEETGGNALALVELAESLSAAQLAGADPLPSPLRLTDRVQEAFLGRVRLLPEATQTLLLVAAADDTGEAAVVFKAAQRLGSDPGALEAAERARLVEVDPHGRVGFRHPLVRAAIYQAATFTVRTAAHRALAAVLDGEGYVDRRAWHLAASVTGPDDEIAAELARSAEVAQQRGGHAVASAALVRAADLSAEPAMRARRLVAAAQAAYEAGDIDRAAELAGRAEPVIGDGAAGNELVLLQGRIEFTRGSSVTAHTLLVRAARALAERDPRAAAAVLVEAGRAAWNADAAGRLEETVRLLEALPLAATDPIGPLVSTTIGASDHLAGRLAEAAARIRGGTDAQVGLVSSGRVTGQDARVVEASLAMAGFTRVTGDDAAGLTLGEWVVAVCRNRGLAGQLAWALVNLSMTEALAGRHSAAMVNATEGFRLAGDLGQDLATCGCQSVLAWLAGVRGDEERCRELAADAVRLSQTRQAPSVAVFATWALGLLDLSLGRPDDALDRLLDRTRGPLAVPTTMCLVVPDLVEAAARAGRTDGLEDIVAWYERWAGGTGQPWAEAAVHRCRALLTASAEPDYQQALRLHEQAGADHRPYDRARTQLLYGQWLRRARRRLDARAQLAAAHETFQRLGATPWAERAAAELRASGQTARRRRDPAGARLTPQEMQVVRLVAEGGSNQDVAAKLFLSPRTVAYHLYKAYPKLGVASRADLARIDLNALLTTQ